MKEIILNRSSPIPLHYQLSNHIKKQIEEGILKPGDPLLPESEIASLAGVSTTVVRQALSYLRRAGLIITQRGKGTFVAKPKTTLEFIQRTYSSHEELVKMGVKVSTKVLVLEEIPVVFAFLLNKLGLSGNEHVIKLSRLRFVNGVPMFLWTSYLPFRLCQPLLREDFTKVSLYKALKDKCNLHITKARRWIEVAKADFYKAKLLEIPELEPLFRIESIAYTDKEVPVEYYEGWYRTDNTKFYFEVGGEK